MTTHVLVGADSCRDYEFLAPLSALLWRDRIGFHPIVLKVFKADEVVQERSMVAHDFLKMMGLDFYMVPAVEGWETGRTAQQCRELAGCLPLQDNDWAMPSDADLWPIKKEFYYQHYKHPTPTSAAEVVSYYANGDHFQTLPTCHVAMRVKKWRELYGVQAGDSTTAAVKRHCDEWLPKSRVRWPTWGDGFAMWMMDQFIVSEKVMALPEGYVKIERRGHPPVDRIDRGNWQPLTEAIVDAHLLRPADQDEHWPRVRALFAKLLPQHVAVVDEYRDLYVKGYHNAGTS